MFKLTPNTITASSEFSSSYLATFAIDGDTATRWASSNKTDIQYLIVDMGAVVKIASLKAMCSASYAPEVFMLQGSNNGTSFATIATGLTITAGLEYSAFAVNASYRYFKLLFTSTANASFFEIREIEFYGTNYKTSGSAIFTATGITGTVAASSVNWAESKPDGTTLTVSVSTDGTNYSAVTNGGTLLTAGTVLDNATIYVKVEMATTDATVTPTLSNLAISLQSTADLNSIVLEMQPLERFESAAGNIVVAYDGSGTLQGAGGHVAAFTQSFAPSDLIPKPDQNDQEHINIASISAASNLMRIYYTNAYGNEHINIASIIAVGTLTNINDL